jgi:hypothetical protein
LKACAAVLFALLMACSTPEPKPVALPTQPVKITQFYTTTPKVRPGEEITICYGVESAEAVRIEPAVEKLVPSVARCITFPPQGNTYKLIARGKRGDEVTQSLTIGAALAAPKFVDLQVSSTTVKAGNAIQFCFKAVNATSVTGGPGKFVHGGRAAGDCLLDNPRQTTTYRLTVASSDGQQDTDTVTVRVTP